MDRAWHGAQPGEDPHPATSRARPDRTARAGARRLAPTFLQSRRHGTLGDFAAGGPAVRHDICGYRLATVQNQFVPSDPLPRSEEHTSELQSLMRISYAVFCLKKKKKHTIN